MSDFDAAMADYWETAIILSRTASLTDHGHDKMGLADSAGARALAAHHGDQVLDVLGSASHRLVQTATARLPGMPFIAASPCPAPLRG